MANVIVKDVGPCKKHLKITVPHEDVQKKIEESYSKLRNSAAVDGFRKGHVPRRLLERRYGEQILEEVKEDILSDASQKAVEKEGLKPIGAPSFDNVEFDTEKDCVFEVTIEVEPQFELAEYNGLKLRRKAVQVTDEEVEHGIEALRRQRARLELMPQETAVIQADDHIVCDWELAAEGELAASGNDDQIIVRGRRFGGVEIEQDISETLPGARFGQGRDMKVKFLDSYPIEKWRGKEGVLTVKPKEIRRPVLPELNEEFAKSLDFDSLSEMRNYAQKSIQQSKERDVAMDLEQQIFDILLERMPFELPEGALKAQASNIMRRQQFRLQQRGVPEEEIEKHFDDLRGHSEEAAARNLKVFFILSRIAEKEKVFVTEDEVEARIAGLASHYRTSPQRMRATLEEEGSLSELRAGMREDKIVGFLLKTAKVESAK